jgi:hypothetical protein
LTSTAVALAPEPQTQQLARPSVATLREYFDACWRRYSRLRAWRSDRDDPYAPRVRVVRMDSPACDKNWRPQKFDRALWMLDFERHGREALDDSGEGALPARADGAPDRRFVRSTKGPRRLFEVYFVQGVGYRDSIGILDVSPGTFDWWMAEAKRICGARYRSVKLLRA